MPAERSVGTAKKALLLYPENFVIEFVVSLQCMCSEWCM